MIPTQNNKPTYGAFLDPLEVQYIDGKNWRLLTGFDYQDDAVHKGVTITAPIGFETDFASIPQILWNILPPIEKYGKAAVIHDLLYRTGGKGLIPAVLSPAYTRAESDAVLRDAMRALGVPGWKIYAMYSAVRAFGGAAWRGGPERGKQ